MTLEGILFNIYILFILLTSLICVDMMQEGTATL